MKSTDTMISMVKEKYNLDDLETVSIMYLYLAELFAGMLIFCCGVFLYLTIFEIPIFANKFELNLVFDRLYLVFTLVFTLNAREFYSSRGERWHLMG